MAQILVLDSGVRKTSSLNLGLDGTSIDLGAAAGVITLGGGGGGSTLSLGGNLDLNAKSFTGDALFDDNVTITGNLTVNGTTVTMNSQVVLIEDNIHVVNSGPSGSRNAGYAVERYQTANNAGTGDVVTDSNALIATISDIGDQTGQDSTHVYLGAGASAVDDYFAGAWVKSSVGDGSNVRKVTAYNGTTKIATIATAWDTQPSSNSQVQLYAPFTAMIYDESNNAWRGVCLTANDVIVGNISAQFAATTVTTLLASTGITSPYAKSSGGDFTVAGGMGSGGVLLKTNGENGTLKLDIDHSSGLTVYDDMQPDTDSAYNFGSSSAAWATGFFDTLTSLNANDRLKLGTDAQVLLSLPVFTTTQITDNIATPTEGDLVYDSTTHSLKYRSDSAWVSLSSSGDTSGLTGTTSLSYTINSDADGLADEDASLVLKSADGGENVDTGTLSYVFGGDGANNGTWAFGANVRIADSKQVQFGADSEVDLSWNDGSGFFDVNVLGALQIDTQDGISIDAGAASNFTVTGGADLTLSTVGGGNVAITSSLDVTVTSTTLTVDTTAGISLDAADTSNLTVTGADLTVSTVTSGILALTSAGALNLSAGAASTYGIVDNSSTSLVIGESTNAYLTLDTTNGSEVISFGNATTNQKVKIVGSGGLVVGQTGTAAAPFAVHFDTPATHAAISAGSIVYIDAAGKVQLADADAAANSQVAGVALDASALDTVNTIRVAIFGKIASAAGGGAWTAGASLYLSTTDGQFTATAPSGSGDVVLPMGIATGASSLLLRVGEPIILP